MSGSFHSSYRDTENGLRATVRTKVIPANTVRMLPLNSGSTGNLKIGRESRWEKLRLHDRAKSSIGR